MSIHRLQEGVGTLRHKKLLSFASQTQKCIGHKSSCQTQRHHSYSVLPLVISFLPSHVRFEVAPFHLGNKSCSENQSWNMNTQPWNHTPDLSGFFDKHATFSKPALGSGPGHLASLALRLQSSRFHSARELREPRSVAQLRNTRPIVSSTLSPEA